MSKTVFDALDALLSQLCGAWSPPTSSYTSTTVHCTISLLPTIIISTDLFISLHNNNVSGLS